MQSSKGKFTTTKFTTQGFNPNAQNPQPKSQYTNVSKTSKSQTYCNARRLMIQQMRSECQLKLLEELLSQKVGTTKVEAQVAKITETQKSKRKEDMERNLKVIEAVLKTKVTDARRIYKENK